MKSRYLSPKRLDQNGEGKRRKDGTRVRMRDRDPCSKGSMGRKIKGNKWKTKRMGMMGREEGKLDYGMV